MLPSPLQSEFILFSETYQTYKTNRFDQTDGRPVSESVNRRRTTNVQSSSKTTSSEFEVSSLLKDAPPDSIKQTINVEREEEEILGPLPEGEDGSDPTAMLNMDTVSEKVDLGLVDGVAQVAVKVRCERVVPIRGVEDMFKKSSVIVTRLIEIDLQATAERRRLYQNIVNTSDTAMITDGKGKNKSRAGLSKLSTKQTFNLYKTFMGLAEADEASKKNEHVQIDRRVEEEHMPKQAMMNMSQAQNGGGMQHQDDDMQEESDTDIDELERRLEAQIATYSKMKPPEPDTESYMSAVSENHSMMY